MIKIARIETGPRGVFKAIDDGRQIGEMSYFWRDRDTFAIDHTRVAPAFEGKGVGKELVEAAVIYARENNLKIMPLCSFANAVFKRKPEYDDVLERN
ncbi:N-acetyltransferase [Bacteroidales bacterium OttesenSCG-928-J19]|nr:N-acetyltransferase [Bacteroidales bacterium OttesenSCG-928-J19]